VDPSIDAASGSGTKGDPYGDLQHALDTITRDTGNGDRINIKAGTAEILTGAISLATYGNPTSSAALTFQGYTTDEGDGGIGEIDANNSTYSVFNSTSIDYVNWKDLKMGNTGSATYIVEGDIGFVFDNCEIHTGSIGVRGDTGLGVINCHFHTITNESINCNQSSPYVVGNYLDSDHAGFTGTHVIDANVNEAFVAFNIIRVKSGAGRGISLSPSARSMVMNNSVWSDGGTGEGIWLSGSTFATTVMNNAVQGFSGTGGGGIDLNSSAYRNWIINNTYYDNATNEKDWSGEELAFGNEGASASLFSDPANATYANRFTDFAPEDVLNMREGGYPTGINLDRGAAQLTGGGGGGGSAPTAKRVMIPGGLSL
jgi:hypothetical protein